MKFSLDKLITKILTLSVVNKDRLLSAIFDFKEQKENAFYTVHKRPINIADSGYPLNEKTNTDQAIVIQGPIIQKNNFTYETVKLYARQVGATSIILSTWENEQPAVLKQFEDLGITIILNQLPVYSGNQNINFQIANTHSGLVAAKKNGCKYVLKTRTDQRIYSPVALQLFKDLTTVFPYKGQAPQKERLIISSLGTIKYRLYGASDMLMYGNIDDMLNYWDVEMDMRKLELKGPRDYTIKEFSQLRLGEMYFCSKYFEKMGYQLDWTLQQAWELLAKHFCVIDDSSIDLYWPKYDLRNEYRYRYYFAHSLQAMTFSDWLSLHTESFHAFPEEYLNEPFGERITC